MDDLIVVDYLPEYGRDLVEMWRKSFERAVGVANGHPFDEQLQFLNVKLVIENRVVVVVEQRTSKVIGFMASTPDTISQLYLHVDHQSQGIGSLLMGLAKQRSSGRLRLFTFKSNTNAQRFYKQHGFRIVKVGFENELGLEDIEYEWTQFDVSNDSESAPK